MIDLTDELPITLKEATKLKPLQRNGRRPHIATLYRWVQRGVRGVKLESVQVGASCCTTAEAVLRFIERLTQGARGEPATTWRTSAQRAKAAATAEKELDAAGF